MRLAQILAVAASMAAASAMANDTVRGNLLAPKAFRAAAAKVRPSVVTIESFGGVTASGGRGAGSSFKPGEGPTTGIVISSDGYILTSTFNFLTRPPIITVIFANGQRHVAKLLGRDDTRKLCLLKIDGVSDLPVAETVPAKELKVGQWAVALGFGFGESEPSLSAGIISATSRVSGKAVQTDANLSPANYGGPLVDIEGRLIGVCVPLSPGSKEVTAGAEWYDSGIGFAVPVAELDSIISQLKEGKHLQPGYLGVQVGPTGDPPSGAAVGKVLPDSAGEKAGLKEKDQILKVNDDEVIDTSHLSVLIGKYVLGETIKLTIKRGEETLTLDVTLAEAPKPPPMPMTAVPMPGKPGDQPKEEPKPKDKEDEIK